jgi:hypothetical protein
MGIYDLNLRHTRIHHVASGTVHNQHTWITLHLTEIQPPQGQIILDKLVRVSYS